MPTPADTAAHFLALLEIGPEGPSDLEWLHLADTVQELSDLFTAERPAKGYGDYLDEPQVLAAYGLFFFPQSFERAAYALHRMLARGWKPPASVRILDLGAGPGPCGLAAAAVLQAAGHQVHLTAVDHSAAALRSLRTLAAAAAPPVPCAIHTGPLTAPPAGPFDLVVCGFALNEVLAGRDDDARTQAVRALRPLLAPGGLLLVLEPAFKETAEPLTRVGDALAAGPEFHRWGPQLGAHPCPFRAAKSPHWEHEVRRWNPPPAWERLNRTLHRDGQFLRFAWVALGTEAPPPLPPAPAGGALLRLVSPLEALKGRLIFSAVTPDGQLVSVQLPNKGLSRRDEKELGQKFQRGDVVTLDRWEALGTPGWFRAKVAALGLLDRIPA